MKFPFGDIFRRGSPESTFESGLEKIENRAVAPDSLVQEIQSVIDKWDDPNLPPTFYFGINDADAALQIDATAEYFKEQGYEVEYDHGIGVDDIISPKVRLIGAGDQGSPSMLETTDLAAAPGSGEIKKMPKEIIRLIIHKSKK